MFNFNSEHFVPVQNVKSVRIIRSFSGEMRENADQKNSDTDTFHVVVVI